MFNDLKNAISKLDISNMSPQMRLEYRDILNIPTKILNRVLLENDRETIIDIQINGSETK